MPLSRDEILLYRKLFRLEVFERNAQGYEDFVDDILKAKYPSYQPVKPRGKLGDRKTDGIVPDLGIYFQVYSPEKPHDKIDDAMKKATASIKEMIDTWKNIPIKEYYFALNDKYNNVYADLIDHLAGLKQNYHLENAGLYLAKDLEDDFLQLPEDKIIAILGTLMNPDNIETIDYGILPEIFKHIMNVPYVYDNSDLNIVKLEDKIKFNNLNTCIEKFIFKGAFQQAIIDEYFHNNSSFTRSEIRNQLNALYIEKRNELTLSGKDDLEDLICLALIRHIAPHNSHTICNKAAEDAAWVIIAYFFETCDIFEKPSNA